MAAFPGDYDGTLTVGEPADASRRGFRAGGTEPYGDMEPGNSFVIGSVQYSISDLTVAGDGNSLRIRTDPSLANVNFVLRFGDAAFARGDAKFDGSNKQYQWDTSDNPLSLAVDEEVPVGLARLESTDLGLKGLSVRDVADDSVTVRITLDNPAARKGQLYMQYGYLAFLHLRQGHWGETMTLDIEGRSVVDHVLEGLEGGTGYAVRVSRYPDFPGDKTEKRQFTTRFGALAEGPDSLDHTHELTPYYENEERKGFTLDWTRPMLGYDDVTGYRIVRYYQSRDPALLEIGPQPPVTLAENTGSQATEYTDVGPLANGWYAYVIWALDEVGPNREYSWATATVTDAFDPPGKPVHQDVTIRGRQVTLDWEPSSSGPAPTHYIIQRTVRGLKGTGQLNQIDTLDDNLRGSTFYANEVRGIDLEEYTYVDYYVYAVDALGFRSAPLRLSVTLGPEPWVHPPR